MKIFLIDGIGPFFRQYKKRHVNWSKIPFHSFPKDEEKLRKYFNQVAEDMDTFAGKVSRIGYNSITLDDVVHLTRHEWLELEINNRAGIYEECYRKLFSTCRKYGLDIYLTMDILSLTPLLRKKIGKSKKRVRMYVRSLMEKTLHTYPEIKGVIVRIGECDGKDVKGTFKSELILKTPKEVNSLLKELLPVFEKHDRLLILRTWTAGAYPIGDLIWHKRTTSNILNGIESQNFILSLKYGESDFFRYLPLNKHFFHHNVQKIIEFQARREYEGCGEFPSFIGWDLSDYYEQLKGASNMVGMSVWCQTGGWVPFRRLTYLEEAGIWNELNSYLCIKIFKEQQSVEQALQSFGERIGCTDIDKFIEFLRLGDQVIKELLYIQPFAEKKLFFRRVRIPPLISVYWNNIFINHSVKKVLLTHVHDSEECVKQGYDALEKVTEMKRLAKELGLPVADIEYMYDTFSIFLLAREYYFSPYNEEIRKRIKKAKKGYKKKYPKSVRPRYRVKTNFDPFTLRSAHIRWLTRILLRKKRGYRVLDRLLTLHLLGVAYKLLIRARPKLIPKFAREHAMGIETLFKYDVII